MCADVSWRMRQGQSAGAWPAAQQRPATIAPTITPSAAQRPGALWQPRVATPTVVPGGAAGGLAGPGGAAAAAAGGPASQAAGGDAYVVYSKVNDTHEVVRTLVGEYLESGNNHGRKVYKKLPDKGTEAVDVFLYYWDGRDGAAFEGWWFGNKLGGTQVWSHCTGGSLTPPSTGWKIPWDGTVRPTLCVEKKAAQARPQVAAPLGLAEEQLTGASKEVHEAGAAARKALEEAKAAHGGNYGTLQGLQAAESILSPHPQALIEALKKVTVGHRTATGEESKQLMRLGTAIRAAQVQVNTELTKVRTSKAKAEQEAKAAEAEAKDKHLLEEMLPEAIEKANSAEDLVEKALITSEMIQVSDDNLDEVKRAVDETDTAIKAAQTAIGEARIFLNMKQGKARRFESEAIKNQATTELTKLQTQLQEAQNKLNPLKTVRQDFQQRQEAQKLVAEVLEKLSPAEVECDKVEEATLLVGGEGMTKEMMQQAEEAVHKANNEVSSVLKFILQKKRQATGIVLQELTKLEERAKASEQRLTQLRSSQREAAERSICEGLMKEAGEKIQTVQEAVAKAADAEGPFLMGVEELPLEDTLVAVKACETAATSANTAVSIARMFIATKIVEAKRFTSKNAPEVQEAQAKLKEYQTELEAHTARLSELKAATAARKMAATMREAESEVAKAETLAQRVREAASVLADDSKLLEMSSQEIRAASDETARAEQEANAALAEARKFITARQIESKGKDRSSEVSAELIKYQTRLSTAQADVGKHKKLCGSVESRLAAKKVIEEAVSKLQAAEEKVTKVTELVDALGGESEASGEAGKKSTKAAEAAAAEAQVALKTVGRYLENQTRAQGIAKDEIAKMQPQVKDAQERLDATIQTMKEKSEKVIVDGIVKESEERVKEAEDSVIKVTAAEQPFLNGGDDVPIEDASKLLSDLEAAVQAAHTAVGGAKTFLAMKRLAAKRLSEASFKATSEELSTMQGRLDAVAKKMSETKKGMVERKLSTVKREAEAKVVLVEKKVAEAVEATQALASGEKELGPEEMKAACERAGTTQGEASKCLGETKNFLQGRQRDAKLIALDSSVLSDVSKLLERLTAAQGDLDKQKAVLRDQEHKFVAQRLLTGATEMVEKLERMLQDTVEAAKPLTSDESGMIAEAFLSHAVTALKLHMKSTSKTVAGLFAEIGADGTVSEQQFVAFMGKLPELTKQQDLVLSEEQLKAAFQRMDSAGGGLMKEEDFAEYFRTRFSVNAVVSMTEGLAVKGGKTVRKLEVNEVVEQLEEPQEESGLGLKRLKAKAERDGKEGYITLSGNHGTVYLVPYNAASAREKSIDQAIQELVEHGTATQKYVDTKIEELKSVHKGPLAETKTELLAMGPRIRKVQHERKQLKTQISEAKKKQKQAVENEKRRRQEAMDKQVADTILEETNKALEEAEERGEKAVAAAQALASSKAADQDDPLQAMDAAAKELDAVAELVDKLLAKVKEHMDRTKSATKGPLSEARTVFFKVKVKVNSLQSKVKKQIASLASARKHVDSEAQLAVRRALRAHATSKDIKPDQLFKQLSSDGESVSASTLRAFMEGIPDSGVKPKVLDLGVPPLAAEMTKLTVLDMLQEYKKCVNAIAMTTTFEVKDSKTVRKLAPGEVAEVLESRSTEDATGLSRVRVRAVSDQKEGWVTLKGNQGTAFLEGCSKPFYCCEEAAELQAAFESSSATACKVEPGDVLEVLEGPRQEDPLEIKRMKVKAIKDEKVGWVTSCDEQGREPLQLAELLVCRQSIAITTTFDIAEGKAIRKLAVGEVLEVLEAAKDDPVRSLTRVKAKAKSDGKEGWVTIRGNQGTSYAEESGKHYTCKQEVPLKKKFATTSDTVRMLEEGEVVEATDGPKSETKEGATRVRGRNIKDGSEGWFTLSKKGFKPWDPRAPST